MMSFFWLGLKHKKKYINILHCAAELVRNIVFLYSAETPFSLFHPLYLFEEYCFPLPSSDPTPPLKVEYLVRENQGKSDETFCLVQYSKGLLSL